MEIHEIIAAKEEYEILKHKVSLKDCEVDRLQQQIWDLEAEMEGLEEDALPIKRRMNDLAWELGIKVHKDQLPLFDFSEKSK